MKTKMFCYQCEQTAQGTGCTIQGVCGKSPNVAKLQDLLIFALKGLAWLVLKGRANQINTNEFDNFICQGLFATITNVDFSEASIANWIVLTAAKREQLLTELKSKNINLRELPAEVTLKLADYPSEMLQQAESYNVLDQNEKNADIQSLKSLVLFGTKGIAAYADHAAILGKQDTKIYHFIQKALASMLRYDLPLENWLALAMETGQINLLTMELLDHANHEHFGAPIPTEVPLGVKPGKAIAISGHDLLDLELLLQQTVDKDINVYTHGEMLPAHGYPQLKKYPHFYGHFGTAWQNQQQEFAEFPGAILMTTNCIQKPADTYKNRIFTTGLVEWPDIKHIGANKDFSPVITAALAAEGFKAAADNDHVLTGFAHETLLNSKDKIVELVKAGKIRHFFLVAGCDGAKPGRNYYTNFVEQVPKDCIVLTLACGKFRFFDKKLGNIEGIPRLLDIGQCNDAYSAIQIAVALAKEFNVGVNELPLSFIISWYEQKAVAILLTLLALGIKNIRLGPTLPAFITPNILQVLVDKFGIKPITTPEEDLQAALFSVTSQQI
jgi:hydroxylamine reductase